MVKHLWVLIAAMSAAFFGAALVHGYKGNGLWFSVNLFISTCCMVGSLIVYFLTKEEDETPPAVGAMPNSTPTPVYRVRDAEEAVYDPRPTFIEGLGHGAGKIAEAAGEVGEFSRTWLFRKDWFSLSIWAGAVATISFIAFFSGNWRGQLLERFGVGVILFIAIVLAIASLMAGTAKRTGRQGTPTNQ